MTYDKDTKNDQVIDQDLYEDLDDEEMLALIQESKADALEKEANQAYEKNPHHPAVKWAAWFIAIVMLINVFAFLPETLSIPAIDFLKTSAQLSKDEQVKSYKEAVVVIETGDSKGTGFSISREGLILTNQHVIEGEDQVTVAFSEAGLFQADVIESYPEVDLAILEVRGENLPYLELADQFELDANEKITFIGNPLSFNRIANQGDVLDYIALTDWDEPVVMLDAPVYRGNSGSPVINHQGEVIGIIFATTRTDEYGRVGLFYPIDYYYDYYN